MRTSFRLNGSPSQNISLSDLSPFHKINFTGSPLNSAIFNTSLTEFQKNSNFLDYPYSTKKTTLKYDNPVHKGPKNYKKIYFIFI